MVENPKALKRIYVHNDHWARCLGFAGIAAGAYHFAWYAAIPFAIGTGLHFIWFRRDLRRAAAAERESTNA